MKTKNIILCIILCLTSVFFFSSCDDDDDYGVVTARVVGPYFPLFIDGDSVESVDTDIQSSTKPDKVHVHSVFIFPRLDLKNMDFHKDDVIKFRIIEYEEIEYSGIHTMHRWPKYKGRVVPVN